MSQLKERRQAYAAAIMEIAAVEGRLNQVAGELHAFSSALDGSRQLYETLSDASIPAERRHQIVNDLLEKKSSRVTLAIISMMISAGRIKDLSAVVESLLEEAARRESLEVAYVRTAVELNDKQKNRLKKALSEAVNKELDLKITVDSSLLGGVVATIGDSVIDGSVKSRLQKLKETMEAK